MNLFNELYRLSYGMNPWKLLETEAYLSSSKAEVAEIRIKGEYKWITVIQKARKKE